MGSREGRITGQRRIHTWKYRKYYLKLSIHDRIYSFQYFYHFDCIWLLVYGTSGRYWNISQKNFTESPKAGEMRLWIEGVPYQTSTACAQNTQVILQEGPFVCLHGVWFYLPRAGCFCLFTCHCSFSAGQCDFRGSFSSMKPINAISEIPAVLPKLLMWNKWSCFVWTTICQY